MSILSFIFGESRRHSSSYELSVEVITTVKKTYEIGESELDLKSVIGVEEEEHSARLIPALEFEDVGSLGGRRPSASSVASTPSRIEHTAHQTLTTKVKINNSDEVQRHSERVGREKLPVEIAKLMNDIVHTVAASSTLNVGDDHLLTGAEEERSDAY